MLCASAAAVDLVVGVGDYDDDDDPDSGKLVYYRNVGNSSQPSFEKVDEGSPFDGIDVGGYSTPAFADVDGDWDPDLVVGEGYGMLIYYRNAGTPTQPVFEKVVKENPFDGIDVKYKSAPTFVDLDNDGDIGPEGACRKQLRQTRCAGTSRPSSSSFLGRTQSS